MVGVAYSLHQNWETRLESSKKHLLRSAEMGNMLVESTLVDAAKSLDRTKQSIESSIAKNTLTPHNVHTILKKSFTEFSAFNKSDLLGLMFLIDSHGRMYARNDMYPAEAIDFSDRFYYQDFLQHPDRQLTIGPLLIARTTGDWVFHMAVPIHDERGHLKGVLVQQLLENDIVRELRKYTEANDFSQMMTHFNGNTVSFAYPAPPPPAKSTDGIYPPIFHNLAWATQSQGTGYWRVPGNSKDDLLIGFAPSPVFGLMTYVTLPMAQIYRTFIQSHLYFFVYVLCAMVFVAGIFFYLYKLSVALTLAENKSMHDALTGLHNRRALYESLPLMLRESMRTQQFVTVMFMDIDFFRIFNARYGHEVGDLALQAVAKALAGCCRRPRDFISRWGGEEFVAVIPQAHPVAAEKIATDMLNAVRSLRLNDTPNTFAHITVSVGYVSTVVTADNFDTDLIDIADKAMLHAKHLGRNQSVRFEVPTTITHLLCEPQKETTPSA